MRYVQNVDKAYGNSQNKCFGALTLRGTLLHRFLAMKLCWPKVLTASTLTVFIGVVLLSLFLHDTEAVRAFRKIEGGMTEAEVESVLGFPPLQDVALLLETDWQESWGEQSGAFRVWQIREDVITVRFDGNGKVEGAFFSVVLGGRRPLLHRIREMFGF